MRVFPMAAEVSFQAGRNAAITNKGSPLALLADGRPYVNREIRQTASSGWEAYHHLAQTRRRVSVREKYSSSGHPPQD